MRNAPQELRAKQSAYDKLVHLDLKQKGAQKEAQSRAKKGREQSEKREQQQESKEKKKEDKRQKTRQRQEPGSASNFWRDEYQESPDTEKPKTSRVHK
jgi:hypothetical protein